ncbi:MAG: EamA family transporter [Cyclobacteriaceae bacterium]|nr:EamA family transporter [Cyclobacteriaceae bacterium]
MDTRKHYAAAVSAFLVWGFFSLPLRALKDFTAGEILYFRIASSVIILLVILFGFRRHKLKLDLMRLRTFQPTQRNQIVGLILVGGILLIVNWLIFIYVINAINIKTASFSYFICPVLTAVLGNFMLQERLSHLQWLAVSLCIISCVLLGLNSAAELGYSFAIALSYALYLITQRRNNGFDRLSVLFVQMLFALLILSFSFPWLVNDVPQTFHFYGLIIVVAGVFTVLPLFLNLYALNGINSTTVGILLYINPLMNFIIAFLVFDETITSLQAIGYLIILVALGLFNYPNLQKMRVRLTTRANA